MDLLRRDLHCSKVMRPSNRNLHIPQGKSSVNDAKTIRAINPVNGQENPDQLRQSILPLTSSIIPENVFQPNKSYCFEMENVHSNSIEQWKNISHVRDHLCYECTFSLIPQALSVRRFVSIYSLAKWCLWRFGGADSWLFRLLCTVLVAQRSFVYTFNRA